MREFPVKTREELNSFTPEDRELYLLYASHYLALINPKSKEYRDKYYNDPCQWVLDFVDIKLAAYHLDILKKIKDGHNKIAIFGPHGLGKSVFAAIIILWAGAVSEDCKVITTASAWRQLEEYLWPEVHKWHGRVDWKKVENAGGCKIPRLLTLECHFAKQSKAFAVASDNPVTIEGAHAQRIVYVFDEAKAIPALTWESADGAFSTPGDHLQLALSTPGDTSGVFYSICAHSKGYENWKVCHVSLREAIRAGRISLSWAREKRDAWGVNNPVYQNRVWGIFAKDSDDAVIPLTWVMAAVNRWNAWQNAGGIIPIGHQKIGADTAGLGVDKTCFYYNCKNIIIKIERFKKSRPMELAGKLKNAMGESGILNIEVSYGEGSGTADRLREYEDLSGRVHGVNFGAGCDRTDKSGLIGFVNVRAALWWNMREILDPDNHYETCLPDDPVLIGDLVAPRKKTRSDGKRLVESKDDIKKRIGRSTDDGDACCLAFWEDDTETVPTCGYVA